MGRLSLTRGWRDRNGVPIHLADADRIQDLSGFGGHSTGHLARSLGLDQLQRCLRHAAFHPDVLQLCGIDDRPHGRPSGVVYDGWLCLRKDRFPWAGPHLRVVLVSLDGAVAALPLAAIRNHAGFGVARHVAGPD